MVLQEKKRDTFGFPDFADHFKDGDESDTPNLKSNAIEILGHRLRFMLKRKNKQICGALISETEKGVIPLKVRVKFALRDQADELNVTFIPRWCRSLWKENKEYMTGAIPAKISTWGWACTDFLPESQLRTAAAEADGMVRLEASITASQSSLVTLAGHESCLRGSIPALFASLSGSPTVQLEGREELHLHLPKALLCAHSPVLRAALESPMEEGKSQAITVVDVKPGALKDFSVCLLSGGLPSSIVTDWERLVDLLFVADKYDVQALVDSCISLLSVAITSKTVAPLMKIADGAGFAKLLRCLLYYCLACPARMASVIDSDEYSQFSADLLRNIVAHREVMEQGRFLMYPDSFQYLDVKQEFDNATDWSKLSSSQLRRACFERDLSASGTPAEMIDRLATPSQQLDGEPEAKRQKMQVT
eukprot:TRINITY_DN79998_c0_g1_i1.p1 TRINITY_DN79998_c0_g1~~TRINITY_DN79998_c0_g1_i1.p1  ORF type:complete len:430 (+),score=60.04 TRINITY_DN79998_c0_g1_i1:33-1292(+)